MTLQVTAEAAKHYIDTTILATDLGMRPLVAHCQLGLGKPSHGRSPAGGGAPNTATTMYRELDMIFFLAQTE